MENCNHVTTPKTLFGSHEREGPLKKPKGKQNAMWEGSTIVWIFTIRSESKKPSWTEYCNLALHSHESRSHTQTFMSITPGNRQTERIASSLRSYKKQTRKKKIYIYIYIYIFQPLEIFDSWYGFQFSKFHLRTRSTTASGPNICVCDIGIRFRIDHPCNASQLLRSNGQIRKQLVWIALKIGNVCI